MIAFVIFDGHMRGMDVIVKIFRQYPGLLMLVAGALSATGFAPLGLWPLMLLALALLMHTVFSAASNRAAAWFGWLFGFGHFAVGLNWMAHPFTFQDAMPVALGWFAAPILSLLLAVFPALAAWFSAWLGRSRGKLAFAITFAAFWIVTEYLRATVLTGFAWNPLSSAFVDVAAITRLIGTYGGSGIVALAAGLIWLAAQRQWRDVAIVAILPAFALVMAMLPINAPQIAPVKTTLHVVQPNIGQQDKYRKGFEAENFAKLAAQTQRKTSQSPASPRLILWSEAAIPDNIGEGDVAALDARMRIARLMQPGDIILVGGDKIFKQTTIHAGYMETRWVGAANSLFALDHRGKILWRYDKAHLVPFGEYLPLRSFLKPLGLARLVPGDLDFWPGTGPRSLSLPSGLKVGPQICYEIVFSGEIIDRKNRPNFIFNPSNDAWFGAWFMPQVIAQSRLRAIEEGIPVVRSTPTGISAVIDANGVVIDSLKTGTAGAIIAALPAAHSPTLFAQFGNILPLGLALLLLITAMLLPLARRRSSR